jgi:hypothetical protein
LNETRQTPQRAFRQIIIDELCGHGGIASPTLVYAAVEREGMLLPGDFDLVFGGEARWKNAVRQEARAMRAEGVMARSAKRGEWRLARRDA